MSARRWYRSVAALVLSACASPAPSRVPPSSIVTVAPPPRTLNARERVAAALARREGVRSKRVEITAALDTYLPRPAPVALAAGPSDKRTITIIDEPEIPVRLLGMTSSEMRLFESPSLANQLLVECFSAATRPETVVSELDITNHPTITSVDSTASPNAACVRRLVLARASAAPNDPRRVRFAARLVVDDDGASPPSPKSIDEEIAEILRMIEASKDPSRTRDLTLLLGARRLDAARVDENQRGTYAAAAREAFERLLAAAKDDTKTRAAALHGLSATFVAERRSSEAARAARALVCPSRFPSPAGPEALEQDHPEAYWTLFEDLHLTPISTTTPAMKRTQKPRGGSGPKTWDEETVYRSPYEGCAADQARLEDVPLAWKTEAWRTISDHHAVDLVSGAFRGNRMATALRFALASARGQAAHHVALELGRVLVRQQRYAEAARVLARFATADAIASVDREMLERAAQLVATSITSLDFEGASENEPFVSRSDILETEPNPAVAAQKLRVIADRLEDPAIVPQDAVFSPLVARWTAWELSMSWVMDVAILVQQRWLARFPNHPDAPLVAWEHARGALNRSLTLRTGTPEQVEAAKLAAEAQARLTQYVGTTPWTEAHRGQPELLRRAVEIVNRKLAP